MFYRMGSQLILYYFYSALTKTGTRGCYLKAMVLLSITDSIQFDVASNRQVKYVPAKVDAVVKFPVPQCKTELMEFLRMAGYYSKACPNCSTIGNPLTCLLTNNSIF